MIELILNILSEPSMLNLAFIGPIAGAIAGGSMIGSTISGIMGNRARSRANRRAGAKLEEAYQLLDQVDIPSIESQLFDLERLLLSGTLTPEQEQAILQQQTELRNIVADPRLRDAQMQVLAELDEIVQEGGLDDTAMAQLNQLRNELSRQERASREAIIQNANRRGVGGSGLELAAQLEAQQGAATRASQQGFDIAAQAQRRALDALTNRGQVAGNIRGQDFSEQARTAEAQDAINRFNVAQRSGVQQRNVDRRNQFAQNEQARRDREAEFNVRTTQDEQRRAAQLPGMQYDREKAKAQALGNMLTGQAQNIQQGGQIQADLYGGISSTLGKLGGTVLDRGFSQYDATRGLPKPGGRQMKNPNTGEWEDA